MVRPSLVDPHPPAPSLDAQIAGWSADYLRYLKIRRRSVSHRERVQLSLKHFHRWLSDQYPVQKLSIQVVEEYALWLMDEARPHAGTAREGAPGTLSVATQRAYLIDLRSFLRWCGTRDLLPTQAYRWVPVPPAPRSAPKRARNEDIARILEAAAAHDLRSYAMCCLLIDCGLRAGELATLQIDQCDTKNCVIAVHGKTGYRQVAISTKAAAVLEQWLQVQNQKTMYVFPGRKDGHITADTVYQILNRLKAEAGVTGRINPHAWRHAYISNTALKGGNAALTQIQAGHASIETTQRYFGFGIQELREYQQRVSALPDLMPAEMPSFPAKKRRAPRPNADELRTAILECPNWEALGRRYGVTGAAVKKWAQKWLLLPVYREAKRLRRKS